MDFIYGKDVPIHIRDDWLKQTEQENIYRYCQLASYTYGEQDETDLAPTGLSAEIKSSELIYRFLFEKTQPIVPDLCLVRMYVNLFAPNEVPYYHTDADQGTTFLYYPHTEMWTPNFLGQTEFYVNNRSYMVSPEPNRLVFFNAEILHRATSFRNKHRFTVAIKYE
tara:strand:- start:190 stop:687 length:498 start_codon:yes stop_codon:yes gene_type:complete